MSDENQFLVTERVNSAITMVKEARGVPLSASCVVHRGELLEMLDQARVALPTDLQSANEILLERDSIIEQAQETADQLIAHAREEVAHLVEQTQIVAAAHKEAQKIMADVEAEAKYEREEIESYIDSRLATLEVILNKTLDVVQRGRDKLQGVEDKHVLSELSE
ncbi:MAG: ATP synthase subunit B/B' [Actinomycetes bacterium]